MCAVTVNREEVEPNLESNNQVTKTEKVQIVKCSIGGDH